jgi:hypothetical protein
MQQPSNKFHGEQDNRHDGKLHWPGAGGLPFRGDAIPNLKQAELENLPIVGDTHQATFDLSDEEDSEAYRWVRDRARNGLFTIDFVERHWNEEKQNMIIYVEWTQLYVQMPKGTNPIGGNGNGRSPTNFTLR